MTTSEFAASLNPEQTTALLAVRDDLIAANSQAMLEITNAKADEIAKLNATLAEKDQQFADADTAHQSALAKMKEDADKALKALEEELTGRLAAEKAQAEEIATATANAASNSLESLRTQLLEKHAAEMQAAGERFDKAQADLQECKDLGESQDEANHFTIRTLSKERDDATAQLAATEARQDELAKASATLSANLKAVAAQVEALSVEAGKKLADKLEEKRQEDLAAAEALVLKLKGEQ